MLAQRVVDALRRYGVASTADKGVASCRSVIVSVQVAVVLLMVITGGLLLQTVWRLQHVELGFDVEGIIAIELRLLNPKYSFEGRRARFQEDLLSRIQEVPGVQSVSVTSAVPMRGVDFTYATGPRNGPLRVGRMRSVDPKYFETMQIPLRAGRLFAPFDDFNTRPVMVVSEAYGRLQFGSESPIGKVLDVAGRGVEIIGVVGDVRYERVDAPAAPAFYLPRAGYPSELVCLLVKTHRGMEQEVMKRLTGVVPLVDPEQPVEGVTTVDEIVAGSIADRRFYTVVTASFALLGLLLAAVGIFGVVSRSVSERRRELAIRKAVGASPAQLLVSAVGVGMLPSVLGAVAGVVVALAVSPTLQGFVYETDTHDALTYVSATVFVLVVTLVACLGPAITVLRQSTVSVLRSE